MDSNQARALAVKTLRELLTLAESFGMPVGWVDEDALELHWRCLTGQTDQTEQSGPRMNHDQHTPHSPLLPFGQPLVAIAVAAPTVRLSGYLALNRQILERDACQSISSIYEVIAAVTLAVNHARQFIASFAQASAEECEEQRWPLSQVVVLARGGRLYLEPIKEPLLQS
jgi:hypothetical protein